MLDGLVVLEKMFSALIVTVHLVQMTKEGETWIEKRNPAGRDERPMFSHLIIYLLLRVATNSQEMYTLKFHLVRRGKKKKGKELASITFFHSSSLSPPSAV